MTPEQLAQGGSELINKLITEYPKDNKTVLAVVKYVYNSAIELIQFAEKITEGVSGIGSTKKAFVVASIRELYMKLNPDIPWIIEPFETMLENIVIDVALPPFIDVVVANFNKYGVFKQ